MIRRAAPLLLIVIGVAALLAFSSAPRRHAAFIAYRGPHRVGDMIGPNARVVAVDRDGDPTAVVSTDGRPPVVWVFELADPRTLQALRGARVHSLDGRLWAHPACPSSMCAAGQLGPPIVAAPPPLHIDPCPAVPASELTARLGPAPLTASPSAGTCVWSSHRGGVEVEVGGPALWRYLSRSMATVGAALVDTRHGLRLAVQRGHVTAVLLTYTNPSPATWQPIAEEVASWAASH